MNPGDSVVLLLWHATPFRADKFEDHWRPMAESALDYGATEICMQSGIHPDWGLEDYEGWLRYAKELAPQLHLHAYSPMEVAHMCDVTGFSPRATWSKRKPGWRSRWTSGSGVGESRAS